MKDKRRESSKDQVVESDSVKIEKEFEKIDFFETQFIEIIP